MDASKPGTTRRTPTHRGSSGACDPDSGSPTPHLVKVLGVRDPMPVYGRVVERIAAIAGVQRGLVARDQLIAAAISRSAIGRLIASGHLHRVHRNAYAVGHLAPAPLAAETAALLAFGEVAVLSHLSAALLWEVVRVGDDRIHLTTTKQHRLGIDGVVVHRTSTLTPGDIRIHKNLPITSPARTLLDLADLLEGRDLERALDEALVKRLTSRAVVGRTVREMNGRRGAGRLQRALTRHALPQVTRSELEKRMHQLIRAASLAEPEVNARICGYEVDFLWRRQRLVVEVDGYQFHSSRPAFERDRAKANRLVAAGFAVMRVTWWQMAEEPYAVVARIAEALARADAA